MKNFKPVKRLNHKGENNPNFKGGVRKLGSYYFVLKPGHPRAIKYGQSDYVLRAVVNMEKKLGRKLRKDELPHHKDSNKTNDSPSNLVIQSQAEHRRTHSAGKSNEERARVKRVTDKLPDKGEK